MTTMTIIQDHDEWYCNTRYTRLEKTERKITIVGDGIDVEDEDAKLRARRK